MWGYLKPFSGRVIERDRLSLAALDFGFYFDDPSLPVVVAPVRRVHREWRYVVADGRIVAGSAYAADGRRALPDEPTGEPWTFVQRRATRDRLRPRRMRGRRRAAAVGAEPVQRRRSVCVQRGQRRSDRVFSRRAHRTDIVTRRPYGYSSSSSSPNKMPTRSSTASNGSARTVSPETAVSAIRYPLSLHRWTTSVFSSGLPIQ